MTEHHLISLAIIIVLGIGAQWVSWRLKLPSILMLLIAGLVAGPLLGFLHPNELFGNLLFPIVSIFVAIILFEGGLSLRLSELPKVGRTMFRLISVGALVTWLVTALAARYILELDWSLSVLLGAILVVTGPTVVGPLLRQIQPKGQTGPTLKWEGILIDPVGAVLAVLIFEAIIAGEFNQAPGFVVVGVLQTLLIGLTLGVISAGLMILLLRYHLIPDHLQNGFSLLLAIGAFALSNFLHPESGLLTVTLMGLILANQKWVAVKHIVEFKENLRVLLIGTLFIVLAARLPLSDLLGLGWRGLAFVAVIVLLARPLSVLVSTWGSRFNGRERIFLSWLAPRGIVAASVASLFAFELAERGHAGADMLVSATFIVIIGTVSLYGLTAGPLARKLDLAEEDPQGMLIVGAHALARSLARVLQHQGFRTVLIDTNEKNVEASRAEGLTAYHGNAVSEETLEELDLSGVGRMIAMTSNNEVNALATLHFPEVFSRAEVYQLPIEYDKEISEPPQHLRGRFLFNEQLTFALLSKQIEQGATIEAIPITEEIDYVALQNLHSQQLILLALVTEKQKLTLYTTDYQPIPKPGQTLVCLIPSVVNIPDELVRLPLSQAALN